MVFCEEKLPLSFALLEKSPFSRGARLETVFTSEEFVLSISLGKASDEDLICHAFFHMLTYDCYMHFSA